MCRSEDVGDDEALVTQPVEGLRTPAESPQRLPGILNDHSWNFAGSCRFASNRESEVGFVLKSALHTIAILFGMSLPVRPPQNTLDVWPVGDDVGPPELGAETGVQNVVGGRILHVERELHRPYVFAFQGLLDVFGDLQLFLELKFVFGIVQLAGDLVHPFAQIQLSHVTIDDLLRKAQVAV